VTIRFQHDPVLLEETASRLELQPGAVVVDGTVGGGGHAAMILEQTGPDGVLIGLDLDPAALEAAEQRLEPFRGRFELEHASFRILDRIALASGHPQVDAVLLDLGVSSFQLDEPERGFRFSDEGTGALDMRMNPQQQASARDLLAQAPVAQLETWFREYGELRGARRLARAIATERERTQALDCADLVRLVRETGVGRGRRHHPATRVFQAIRIAVNDELGALREGLAAAERALRPGGRLVVIAYHSLEDRIVKHHFREAARACSCAPEVPICICDGVVTLRVITRKPVTPDFSEIEANPRARSARLRVALRTEAEAA
jgi:16S rRNA (cytosine1402-N4)-methyltransferase